MNPFRRRLNPFFPRLGLFLLALAPLFLARAFLGRTPPRAARGPVPDARVQSSYGRLPLAFEPNQGQTDPRVKFLARGAGYTLFLAGKEAVLVLPGPARPTAPAFHGRFRPVPGPARVVRLRLEGSDLPVSWGGREKLPGSSNYFIGKDPSKWRTGIPRYGRVAARNVYPGIDMVYYGRQGRLEYDFVVRPGADPGRIVLKCGDGKGQGLDGRGDWVLRQGEGRVVFRAPRVYQEIGGKRRRVEARYASLGGGRMGFEVADYDRGRPLVIDPTLAYSTFLGGAGGGNSCNGIAVDSGGNAYVTGVTSSAAFPATGGAFQAASAGGYDVFVSKLDPGGTALLYSTYLGGSAYDNGFAITVDPGGGAYVTGETQSADFPTTAGAFQTLFGGGAYNAFVAKLNATGTALVYSTYLGGNNDDEGYGITLDSGGNAYVTGWAGSLNFPTTAGVFQAVSGGGPSDAFVTKLNPSGSALVYSTFLGGNGPDMGSQVVVDPAGNAYVGGATGSTNFPVMAGAYQSVYGGNPADGFAAELNAAGTSLVYSTYLGGSNGDQVFGAALAPSGDLYLTGYTASTNFPTTAGAFQTTLSGTTDAFAAELNASGTTLVYSTHLGGSSDDTGVQIVLEPDGNADLVGYTRSPDFPLVAGAYQPVFGGVYDVFLARVNPTGTGLAYSTYLGGSSDEYGYAVASDGKGGVYLAGGTNSTDFPTTAGAYQTVNNGSDAFVAKFAFATPTPIPPPPTPTCPIHVWPDPFSLRYSHDHSLKFSCLPAGGRVSIYTLSGELVARFNRWGDPTLWVGGVNQEGRPVAPGIYYYVIDNGNSVLKRGKFLVTP